MDFAARHPAIGFIFVNDGSRDGTAAILNELCRALPRQCIIRDLPAHVGKGEAVRKGLLTALTGAAKAVGYWDADLSTSLDEIPGFLDTLDRAPQVMMVFGRRYGHSSGGRRRGIRGILGRVFAVTASRLLHVDFKDTQCGAKVFRAAPEILAVFETPFTTRLLFDVEIFARLLRINRDAGTIAPDALIREQPLSEWHDKGESRFSFVDFALSIPEIALLYRRL